MNPKSGRGLGVARAEAFQASAGDAHRIEIVETTRRGVASELAREAVGSFDGVIAVGGDGTLNEVLGGLIDGGDATTRPALGFLPSGTANAAVRAFGFPTDPAVLGHLAPTLDPKPIDVGLATWGEEERPFLLWFGAGFDAVVIDTLNRDRTGLMGVAGLLLNAPRVARDLHKYAVPDIEVVADGGEPTSMVSVVMANVGEVGFVGAVVDSADPADGLLDLVAVPRAGKRRTAAMALRMLRSSLHHDEEVGHAQVGRVDLSADGDVPFHLDGEPVGSLPVSVRVLPSAIRLLAP